MNASRMFTVAAVLAGCTDLVGQGPDARAVHTDASQLDASVSPACPLAPDDNATLSTQLVQLPFAQPVHFRGVFLDHARRLYVYGGTLEGNGGLARSAVVRLRPDGTLDASFGSGGYLFLGPSSVGQYFAIYSMAEDSQGRVVLAGYHVTSADAMHIDSAHGWLARVNEAGASDDSFGASGIVEFSATTVIYDVALEGTRIVVAGGDTDEFHVGTVGFAAVLREDGTFDPAFNYGRIRSDFDTVGYSALSVGPSGYVLAGSAREDMGARVVRLHRDGTLDASFGVAGVALHPVVPTLHVRAMSVSRDESIAIAGGDDVRRAAIVRFDSHGVPDLAFGLSGAFVTLLGSWDFGYLLHTTAAAQCDQRMVLALSAANGSGQVIRVSADGRDETSFYGVTSMSQPDSMIGVVVDPSDQSTIAVAGVNGVVTTSLGVWTLRR